MTLYENTVKLRGILGNVQPLPTSNKPVVLLELAIPTGTWKLSTNEWISRTEWHYVLCLGWFFHGYAKTLKQGDYLEIEGELHFFEHDGPIVLRGQPVPAKRDVYQVHATHIRKLEYPPVGIDEGEDT